MEIKPEETMHNINPDMIAKIEAQRAKARQAILTMTTLSASGHPGGSMSSIDFLLCLYELINHNPQDCAWEARDRVVVSNGHISPAVYTALGMHGYFDLDEAIAHFRQTGSIFEGHIEREVPGVEWSSGNLGQGLSAACGMAMAARIKGLDYQVFTVMGDGEQQKGQISEARRFASKYHLNNLTAIIDYNELQISGSIHEVMPQNLTANWESDGWKVIEVNGHDIHALLDTIQAAVEDDNPTMILAHTIMGQGISFMENQAKYHGSTLNEEQLDTALKQLEQPNELKKYRKMREAGVGEHHATDKFAFHPSFLPGSPLFYEADNDCRGAWGNAIADLAKLNAGGDTPLVVVDCDLASSVKTSDFAKAAPERFIQCGIMEQHAAVMSGAMSTCGIQTFWSDFGMFGIAEVYNAQRLNDINHAHLKTVLTHVGIDVGEDGKTHQSIDYISMARNLFGFRLLCPADANHTDRIIRWLVNQAGNYFVTMGRSKLPQLKDHEGKPFYKVDHTFAYGQADLLRVGNHGSLWVCGTPAANALKAVDSLRDEGIFIEFYYVSSPLCIDEQQLKIASAKGPIFSVEDHSVNGGLGSSLAESLVKQNLSQKLVKIGIRDYPNSGQASELYKLAGLDSASILRTIKDNM